LRSGAGSVLFRRVLVVVQFALSVFLIIGTVVVYRQMQYMKTKALGFDKEQVIFIPLRGNTALSYEALRSELRKDSRLLGVTAANHLPPYRQQLGGANRRKGPTQEILPARAASTMIISMSGIELVEGRNFSREFETDKTEAFLVNEEVRNS
jgi:putative ABC transport system permease protein